MALPKLQAFAAAEPTRTAADNASVVSMVAYLAANIEPATDAIATADTASTPLPTPDTDDIADNTAAASTPLPMTDADDAAATTAVVAAGETEPATDTTAASAPMADADDAADENDNDNDNDNAQRAPAVDSSGRPRQSAGPRRPSVFADVDPGTIVRRDDDGVTRSTTTTAIRGGRAPSYQGGGG